MNKLKQINTDQAPKVVGPYSQAIKIGDFLFCSGQIGINPKTNTLIEGGVEKEAEQTLKNLSVVLNAGGLGFKNVVRCDIFIKNIADFIKVNEIYGKYFSSDPKPARQTVEVSNLPKGALIEISCIAYFEK